MSMTVMASGMVALLVAYLIGSLSGSLILGRIRGVDIRRSGSGNAGGTNALRTRGWRFALVVVVIDIGKGAFAALLPLWIGVVPEWRWPLQAACGLAAAVGHVWPVFFGFRGGKGAGTLVGALAVIWPLSLAGVAGVWLMVLLGTGYVGLATVLGAAALVPAALLDPGSVSGERLVFAISAAGFIIFTHRANLQRLRAGNENRFEKARVLPRLFGRRNCS